VWLAANRTTGHLRAVKLIPRRGSAASRELASLTRLEALARQRSHELLPIHHVGQTAEHLFYVMDLADDISGSASGNIPKNIPGSAPGEDESYEPATLDRALQRGPLAPEKCLEHSRQLLRGLAALHDAGIVHRDVKPSNCLFVAGELKLADFGLLTDAGPDASRLGTEKYMPPDGCMDTRADTYAAGLVIYEMITGLPADRFPSLGPEAERILADPTLRVLLRVSISASSTRREDRFQSAGAMAGALEELVERGVPGRRSVSRRGLLAGAGALLLAAAAAVYLMTGRDPGLVDVNFITRPFDAAVYLDGKPVERADRTPYRTPCTVEGLPARPHHVEFKLEGYPTLDAGSFDFAETRQITVSWPGADSD
jgi:serine/threonine protein kinase